MTDFNLILIRLSSSYDLTGIVHIWTVALTSVCTVFLDAYSGDVCRDVITCQGTIGIIFGVTNSALQQITNDYRAWCVSLGNMYFRKSQTQTENRIRNHLRVQIITVDLPKRMGSGFRLV